MTPKRQAQITRIFLLLSEEDKQSLRRLLARFPDGVEAFTGEVLPFTVTEQTVTPDYDEQGRPYAFLWETAVTIRPGKVKIKVRTIVAGRTDRYIRTTLLGEDYFSAAAADVLAFPLQDDVVIKRLKR